MFVCHNQQHQTAKATTTIININDDNNKGRICTNVCMLLTKLEKNVLSNTGEMFTKCFSCCCCL